MNLMDLFIKIGVDDQASGKMGEISSDMIAKGQLIADAISSAVSFASEQIVEFGKMAIESYADYEQLVGGIETLFGTGGLSIEEYAEKEGKTVAEAEKDYRKLEKSQTAMLERAKKAYKTAGLSTNDYMETATSFAASLIQSLGGDTEKAVEYVDIAVTDMADNANKMGTDISMIQNAYQGFAKSNYTMLDNLNTMGASVA